MESWGSQGIILKRKDVGEADRLLTIFTKRRGKIRVIAKGVRRIKSRRAANVELLNYSKLYFQSKKDLHLLQEAETIKSFPTLKSDLKKIGLAYRLAETVERLFDDQEEPKEAFELLETVLEILDQSQNLNQCKLASFAFGLKILERAGYRPQVYVCSKCGLPLSPQIQLFAPDLGGLVDRGCASSSLLARPISPEGIKALRFLLDSSWQEIGKLSVGEAFIREIEQVTTFYLEYLLESKLHSFGFLTKVESL